MNLFSENWYVICRNCFYLPSYVDIRKQFWNGVPWFVLTDPFTNNSYRVSTEAWEFLKSLSPRRNLDSVWNSSIEFNPLITPGQNEVITLLAHLSREGLLLCEGKSDLDSLFENISTRKRRARWASALNFLFLPIPLWDPDKFLKLIAPLGRLVFSRIGFLTWTLTLFAGLLSVFDQNHVIWEKSQTLLALDNLAWLYACWAGVKMCHEMGHAMACRHFGGEVHTMGVMLIVFVPMPYVDASSAWRIRDAWKRCVVGAAGVMAEVFIASLAAIIWANTGGGLLNSLCYNIMFLASVSTLVFNLNPLLKLDGYYIFSDLVGLPNLHQNSRLKFLADCNRIFLGIKERFRTEYSLFETVFFPLYTTASALYRLLVLVMILWFISERFFNLGLVLAVVTAVVWFVVPLFKFVFYLLFDERVLRVFPRGAVVLGILLSLGTATLFYIPLPSSFTAAGIVRKDGQAGLLSKTGGRIVRFCVQSGDRVERGEPLIILENPEADFEKKELHARVDRARMELEISMVSQDGYHPGLKHELKALENSLAEKQKSIDNLVIKSPCDGVFWNSDAGLIAGAYLQKGQEAGTILQESPLIFETLIPQAQGDAVFDGKTLGASVRLNGRPWQLIPAEIVSISPSDRTELPHQALGIAGGGDMQVDLNDPRGLKTREPFFRVCLQLSPTPQPSPGHLHRGRACFEFKKSPLGSQLFRWMKQILQKRYKL